MQEKGVDKEVPREVHSNKESMNPTYGVTRYKGKEFVYTWFIDNFKTTFIDNESLNSPTFSTNVGEKIMWFLKMKSYDSEKLVLQLCISLQAGKNIEYKNKVYADIAVVDGKGREKISVQSSFVPVNVKSAETGANLYLKRTDLSSRTIYELSCNGTIIIKCKLFFMDTIVDETESTSFLKKVPCNCNLKNLFETKKLSDVVLIAGAQKFEAHKCILAAQSPVFSATFEHDMKEKNKNEVEIDDIEPQVLEELLQYIYSGKNKGFQDVSSLLIAADKYQIDDLKSICEHHLINEMDVENVGKTLILADHYKAQVLKKSVIKFIVTHSSEIELDKFKEDVQFYSPLLIDIVQGLI